MRGRDRRQELELARGLQPAHFEHEIAGSIEVTSHGAQQRLLGLYAEELQLAAVVVVCISDSAQPRQSFDRGRIH